MRKARRNSNSDHRSLYKRTSISRTPDELTKRRVAINDSLRKKHREQLITAKRFRNLTRQEEYESAGEDEPNSEKKHDEEISPYYRLTESQIESIANDLSSNDVNLRIMAAQHISKFVVEPSQTLIDYITKGDCIKTLTQMISSSNPEEQIEATQTISNIAAGPYALWLKSVSTVPYLISLLDSENINLREIAAGAIGNIAAEDLGDMNDEDDRARATIRDNGAIKPLVRLLDTNDSKLIQSTCFALANLARGEEGQLKEFLNVNLPEKLMLHLSKHETCTEVCWVLSYLTAGSDRFREELMGKGFVGPLVENLIKLIGEGPAVLSVLRTIGNLVSSDDYLKVFAEQEYFLSFVIKLIHPDQSRVVKKEALWVLSNITSTKDVEIIEKLESLEIIKYLSELIIQGAFDIRKGAAYCIMNIANHGAEHLNQLSHKQLLSAFLDLLKSQDADMIRLGLGYIELLLTQLPKGEEILDSIPDCMEALAAVTPSPDPELFAFANKLVDQYFGESQSMQE